MTRVNVFIRQHPVLTYFAVTFAISWTGVLLIIGRSGAMSGTAPTADEWFVYALVAMLAGPSISGVVLAALVERREGLRGFLTRVLEWRIAVSWYAVALLTAPILWMATLFALSLTSSSFVPGILTSTDRTGLVMAGVMVALAAGIFEELGWTGFAIPQLRRRHGVLATGLIVGVVWGAWHLLTNVFWAGRASAGELPLSFFLPASVASVLIGYLAAFRVLMVWVYDHTQSLLLAMLMHASLTASVLILDPAGLSGVALLTYSFALAASVWTVVGVIGARTHWRFAPRPRRSVERAA